MSNLQKALLERTLKQQSLKKGSASFYSLGPTEPVTELVVPSAAWIVNCKYGSEVLVSTGGSALPMIDIDAPFYDQPLAEIEKQLLKTELMLQLRVYETAHGLRLLVESQTLSPAGGVFRHLAESLCCDPSYLHLCQQQNSYRARLTPKPGAEAGARVCRYLGTVSSIQTGLIDEALADLVRLHDERTGALLDSGVLG